MIEKLKNLTKEQVDGVFINDLNKKFDSDSWVVVAAKKNQMGINFFIDTAKTALAMGGGKNFSMSPISTYIDNLGSTRRLFNNKNTIFVHYPKENEDDSYDIHSKEIKTFKDLESLISPLGLLSRTKSKEDDRIRDGELPDRIRESLSRYLSEKRSQLKTNIGVAGKKIDTNDDDRPRGRLYPPGRRIRRV